MTTDKVLVQVGSDVVELTGAKKTEFLARVAEDTARDLAREQEKQDKIAAKAALLARLGMTADEAALLLS